MEQRIPLNLEWCELFRRFPTLKHRYLRGVFLASILEPKDRSKQKRVLSAVFSELARKITRLNNPDEALLRVGSQLLKFCVEHSTSSRSAGSEIAYRRKLTIKWREPTSRTRRRISESEESLSSSPKLEVAVRRQNHLMEVNTVAALVDIMRSGKASGSRGRATMEAAREFLVANRPSAQIGRVFTNQFDIKTAWNRKGSVAQLCSALVHLLEQGDSAELTSLNYTKWAENMDSFLFLAFQYQKYLTTPNNFVSQSRIPTSIVSLPDSLKP